MNLFSFGKKRKKVSRRKVAKKPPASLLKRCRKYRIKTTMKKGGKRVYRKVSMLKKLLKKFLKKKMHKIKKARKVRKTTHRRRMGFGADGYEFTKPANYGFDQTVQQYPGTLSQTISTITAKNNISRPEGFSFEDGQIPAYGVFRDFFGEAVPTQVPPNYNFMGQPNKSLMPVGAPFQRYTKPNSFGKKRRYNVAGSACNKLKRKTCRSNPNCSYTRRGCRRRTGTKGGSVVYEGPSLAFGKRRRRYNVAGSMCNKLKRKTCRSNPNCSYTKRGCRRRQGTKGGAIYEGPSLAFGSRRSRFGFI